MSTPAEVVSSQFSAATAYADDALDQLHTFTDALADAIYTAPTFDVTWTAIDPPTPVTLPARPAAMDDAIAGLVWNAGAVPSTVTPSAPSIDIDDFDVVSPTLNLPTEPVLDFGTAPTIDYGSKPVAPSITDIVVPDTPTLTLPDTPSYLSLTTPTFGGLDLHSAMLTSIEGDLPAAPLDLVSPTPYTYTPNPAYTSSLLTALRNVLTTRIGGGTGLDPAVEAQIWDRARSRETKLGQANEDDVTRNAENLGFKLPTGILTHQLRGAQQDAVDKISTLSRDIAIKQADLEQTNLDKSLQLALDCEGKLIDQALQMERIAFESAQVVAKNSIDIHNAAVDRLKVLLQRYSEFRQAYATIIEGERLKLEQYRAELQGEETKANVNRTLVEEYRAKIAAQESLVRLFEAQLAGVKAQVDIENARVQRFGEEIRAYVAGVNGETAKVEAYKVGVEAQKIRVDAYEGGVRGQLARVEVYKAQASAFGEKARAQGDKARAQLGYYEAIIRSNVAQFDGYSARARAEAERFRGLTAASTSLLDTYRAETEVALKTAEQDIRRWEIGIKQYDGQANYTLQAAKINADVINATRESNFHAAQVGAQVYAQVTGSALGMIHTSAGVSASASDSVSYSYSNDTDSAPPSITTV